MPWLPPGRKSPYTTGPVLGFRRDWGHVLVRHLRSPRLHLQQSIRPRCRSCRGGGPLATFRARVQTRADHARTATRQAERRRRHSTLDLQGRPGSGTKRMAIPGAVRINPRRLEQYWEVEIPRSQQVVLYCACPGEFTSAGVALALRQKGIEDVRPLAGGLQGWRDRGFPVTTEVQVPVTPFVRS